MKTYQFMAEIADRRSKEYKTLNAELERLERVCGKESVEVKKFFDIPYDLALRTLTK